mmetsp:Transcript_35733/g.54684  ORF Transcript_35733/g.54684 Transcript_35733/m.54684 type:complete len:105 (+) Transcript_35733:1434-1748(+)
MESTFQLRSRRGSQSPSRLLKKKAQEFTLNNISKKSLKLEEEEPVKCSPETLMEQVSKKDEATSKIFQIRRLVNRNSDLVEQVGLNKKAKSRHPSRAHSRITKR